MHRGKQLLKGDGRGVQLVTGAYSGIQEMCTGRTGDDSENTVGGMGRQGIFIRKGVFRASSDI